VHHPDMIYKTIY